MFLPGFVCWSVALKEWVQVERCEKRKEATFQLKHVDTQTIKQHKSLHHFDKHYQLKSCPSVFEKNIILTF